MFPACSLHVPCMLNMHATRAWTQRLSGRRYRQRRRARRAAGTSAHMAQSAEHCSYMVQWQDSQNARSLRSSQSRRAKTQPGRPRHLERHRERAAAAANGRKNIDPEQTLTSQRVPPKQRRTQGAGRRCKISARSMHVLRMFGSCPADTRCPNWRLTRGTATATIQSPRTRLHSPIGGPQQQPVSLTGGR